MADQQGCDVNIGTVFEETVRSENSDALQLLLECPTVSLMEVTTILGTSDRQLFGINTKATFYESIRQMLSKHLLKRLGPEINIRRVFENAARTENPDALQQLWNNQTVPVGDVIKILGESDRQLFETDTPTIAHNQMRQKLSQYLETRLGPDNICTVFEETVRNKNPDALQKLWNNQTVSLVDVIKMLGKSDRELFTTDTPTAVHNQMRQKLSQYLLDRLGPGIGIHSVLKVAVRYGCTFTVQDVLKNQGVSKDVIIAMQCINDRQLFWERTEESARGEIRQILSQKLKVMCL